MKISHLPRWHKTEGTFYRNTISMTIKIMQSHSIERFQNYLDTGYYPDGIYSKTWDMLEWIDFIKKQDN